MAQPSVACYFNTRKRTALDELKATRSRKVLVLENNETDTDIATLKALSNVKKAIFSENNNKDEAFSKAALVDGNDLNSKIVNVKNVENKTKPQVGAKKTVKILKPKKVKETPNQLDIHELLNNMKKDTTEITETEISETTVEAPMEVDPVQLHKTPPASPAKKVNVMDKVKMTGNEMSLNQIKQKLSRSSRLAELKASMARFKESAAKLEQIEKKIQAPDSPSLKAFKTIELEVTLSPKKVQVAEKAYLSPKKDTTARRNLLNLLSPTKNAVAIPQSPSKQLFAPQKAALTLPYKYRSIAELFRSIDTVCQIMHNRKEIITFRKLKPAVEELLKKNLKECHLAQIKSIYPESFNFKQEKLRVYAAGGKQERWELVIEPVISQDSMTSDILLERRRKMFSMLIEKVKKYHQEFLLSLEPPMIIPIDKLTRWHPEFDIERVNDIEAAELPQSPNEEAYTTGKDVLEKARSMFNCNTRMEQALERLKKSQESKATETEPEPPKEVTSVLKGIPKSLLEKVRQKQAAKALESMTRSDAKDKEIQLYSRLPEFARLTRNLFVAEKKSVLPLDVILEKLSNSLRHFMTKTDIELHLKTLAKEIPTWMVFHTIRNCVFIKISKDADISLVLNKLDKLIKNKTSV